MNTLTPRRPNAKPDPTPATKAGASFLDHLAAAYGGEWLRDNLQVGLPIPEARKFLSGIPREIIPTVRAYHSPTGRSRRCVIVERLVLLCACLDESGATRKNSTPEQVYLAWLAAGFESYFRIAVEKHRFRRAVAPWLPSVVLDSIFSDSERPGQRLTQDGVP